MQNKPTCPLWKTKINKEGREAGLPQKTRALQVAQGQGASTWTERVACCSRDNLSVLIFVGNSWIQKITSGQTITLAEISKMTKVGNTKHNWGSKPMEKLSFHTHQWHTQVLHLGRLTALWLWNLEIMAFAQTRSTKDQCSLDHHGESYHEGIYCISNGPLISAKPAEKQPKETKQISWYTDESPGLKKTTQQE